MLRGVLILVLVTYLTAAPALQDIDKGQTLIRIKRDTPAATQKDASDEAKELDKKAEISVETRPAENKDVSPDIVDEPPSNDDGGDISGGADQTGDLNEPNDDALINAQKEEAINKIFDEEDNNNDVSEKEKMVDKIMSENEPEEENPLKQYQDPSYREYLLSKLRTYYNDPNYLPYYNDGANRRKRNALPKAVTAEQMGRSQLKLKLRRKRDLDITPEELEYLLEVEEDFPQEQEQGPVDSYEETEAPAINMPEEYGPQEEYGSDGDAIANAELLNYLYENAREEADDNYLPPEDVKESWEEYLPEEEREEVLYEPIVYHGTPGIFVPIEQKRQYLSMVPGNRRKRNFYPADDTLSGRWGAFISDQEAVKRANAYDRLYELAEQLRSSPYDQNYFKKK